jgi:drug/metabolite transporter (DMT)-like permease
VTLALTLVQIFFGLHYVAAKVLLQHIPPRAWAAVRVTAAALVLLAAARVLRRPLPRRPGDLRRIALYSIFGVVVNQICFVEGLSRTTPTHSSLVNTTIPVGTLLFAVFLGRERLDRSKILSLAVSLAGVLLVMMPKASGWTGGTFVGDVLTLVNALSYSLFLVISKPVLARTDPMGATAALMAFGALGVLALGGPSLARFDLSTLTAEDWALAAFIVVFATAGAYLLNYWALARVDSSLVALFIYLQPAVAVTLSAVLTGDLPGATEILGAALIFAGVYLAVPRPGRRAPCRA